MNNSGEIALLPDAIGLFSVIHPDHWNAQEKAIAERIRQGLHLGQDIWDFPQARGFVEFRGERGIVLLTHFVDQRTYAQRKVGWDVEERMAGDWSDCRKLNVVSALYRVDRDGLIGPLLLGELISGDGTYDALVDLLPADAARMAFNRWVVMGRGPDEVRRYVESEIGSIWAVRDPALRRELEAQTIWKSIARFPSQSGGTCELFCREGLDGDLAVMIRTAKSDCETVFQADLGINCLHDALVAAAPESLTSVLAALAACKEESVADIADSFINLGFRRIEYD